MTITKEPHGESVVLFIKGTEEEIRGELYLLYNCGAIEQIPQIEEPCTTCVVPVPRLLEKLSYWKAGREAAELDMPHGKRARQTRRQIFDKIMDKTRQATAQWYANLADEPRLATQAYAIMAHALGKMENDLAAQNHVGYRLISESPTEAKND